jgi:uncharacterized protein YjbI with pentapeptide repeats
MKRFFLGIIATMAVLFSTSCSNNEIDEQAGSDAIVSFNLNVENIMKTRAISDGLKVDQLMFAIFGENGELIIPKVVKDDYQVQDMHSKNGYRLQLSLIKGHKYKAVFWAQNSECTAYTVSDDMKVTIDYEGLNNDDNRDAFFAATEEFTVKGSETQTVILTRPFAQINVGSYPFDFEQAKKYGVEIKKSKAVIKNVPNNINLIDGTISGDTTVTYEFNTIPDENLFADLDDNNIKEAYKYVSMSYILAGEKSIHDMDFYFSNETGDKFIEFAGLTNIPVTRNWRTNILGQVLTSEANFVVKVSPAFIDDSNKFDGIYYKFSEDTEIRDTLFALNNLGAPAIFTSVSGQKVTLKNVKFSGQIQYLDFGDYIDDGNYTNFNHIFDSVNIVGLTYSATINKHLPPTGKQSKFGAGVWLRGKCTLTNCTIEGSICTNSTAYNVDAAVVNLSEATIKNSKIGHLYVYEHASATIENCVIDKITSASIRHINDGGKLIIGAGTTVNVIDIVNISNEMPAIEIESGATVKTINFHGLPKTAFKNEGTVNEIID